MTVSLYTPPKGMNFVRFCIAKAVAEKRGEDAGFVARARWGEDSAPAMFVKHELQIKYALSEALRRKAPVTPRSIEQVQVETMIKAAVAGGSLGDSQWLGTLDNYLGQSAEFMAAARERSIIGRINQFRRVPLNVRVISQARTVANWVGEGKGKPLTKSTFTAATLEPRKIVGLAVLSDELVRFASPDSEALIREDLLDAVAKALDDSFIDPNNAGVADVEPASVTYNVTPINPGAQTDAALEDAIVELIHDFVTGGGDLTRAWIVAAPQTLVRFCNDDNPDLTVRGGTLKGIPAVASRYADSDYLILLDAGGIALGQGPIEADISRQATVEMSDAPTQDGVAGSGAQMVSLWQSNLVGIKVEQFCNWAKRDDAVALISGISSSGSI